MDVTSSEQNMFSLPRFGEHVFLMFSLHPTRIAISGNKNSEIYLVVDIKPQLMNPPDHQRPGNDPRSHPRL